MPTLFSYTLSREVGEGGVRASGGGSAGALDTVALPQAGKGEGEGEIRRLQ
jgi:hypothetical protein